MAAEPVFDLERLTLVEGRDIGVQALLEIVGMHPLHPAVSDLRFERATGEIEPRLIDIGAEFIEARHPDHDGSRVRNVAKLFVILAQGRLDGPSGKVLTGHELFSRTGKDTVVIEL